MVDREDLEGDRRCFEVLRDAAFSGPAWDRFAEMLAAYGFPVMEAWVGSGQVFHRMREKCHRLRLEPPSDGRTLAGDAAKELAIETVAYAIQAFRIVLGREGWSATGGASLRTFFIGQCLFSFANVYRRWLGETRPPPWKELQILEDLTEADYRYGCSSCSNPADDVQERLRIEAAEREVDPRIFFILAKCQEGYTQAEIADMLGVRRKTIERLIAGHRRWQQGRREAG